MERIATTGLKIDLHIHSHASSRKDGKKVKNNTLENLPVLVQRLNDQGVEICAITDHDVFSYALYQGLKAAESQEVSIKKVLPGIEFTVDFIVEGSAKALHIVAIFSDADDGKVKNIETIMNNHPIESDGAYSEEQFLQILREIDIDTILIAHQKNTISSKKPRENDATSLGMPKFLEFVYSDYFEAFEFKNKKYEVINKAYLLQEQLAEQVRFVTGTDCHDWSIYKKDPDKRNHLIVDPDTCWIIEKIFDMAVHGAGAAKICKALIAERIPTPGFLNFQRYGTFANIYANQPEEKSYAWTISQVKSILHDETYIGNTIHNRQTNISYKNKRRIRKPVDEWVRVEGTHEPIISKAVFEQVQEQIAHRRRQMKDATTQIFAGIVRCADCNWSMSFGTNRANKTPYSYFNCTSYRQFGKVEGKCTAHYVRYDMLYSYVLSRLQHWSTRAAVDETTLYRELLNAGDKETVAASKKQAAALAKAEKRKAEVNRLFMKLYEDWSSGRITEYNFTMLSEKYQDEQQALAEQVTQLKEALTADRQTTENTVKWLELIKRYVNPTALTAEMLTELIEKIVIHEAVKGEGGQRTQKIEIYYRFVGKID